METLELLHFKSLHVRIHYCIQKLGGYWPPLASVARLLEEIGELQSGLLGHNKKNIREELSDLFFITTCIANQYAAQLEYIHPYLVDLLDKTQHPFNRLLVLSGELARRVNHYEGYKPPKFKECFYSVELLIKLAHCCLSELAQDYQIDFHEAITEKIHLLEKRDTGRFSPTRDPSYFAHPQRVKEILCESVGQSAQSLTKWWYLPLSLDSVADPYCIETLQRFVRIAPWEGLSGLICFSETAVPEEFHTTEGLIQLLKHAHIAAEPGRSDTTPISVKIQEQTWQWYDYSSKDLSFMLLTLHVL